MASGVFISLFWLLLPLTAVEGLMVENPEEIDHSLVWHTDHLIWQPLPHYPLYDQNMNRMSDAWTLMRGEPLSSTIVRVEGAKMCQYRIKTSSSSSSRFLFAFYNRDTDCLIQSYIQQATRGFHYHLPKNYTRFCENLTNLSDGEWEQHGKCGVITSDRLRNSVVHYRLIGNFVYVYCSGIFFFDPTLGRLAECPDLIRRFDVRTWNTLLFAFIDPCTKSSNSNKTESPKQLEYFFINPLNNNQNNHHHHHQSTIRKHCPSFVEKNPKLVLCLVLGLFIGCILYLAYLFSCISAKLNLPHCQYRYSPARMKYETCV